MNQPPNHDDAMRDQLAAYALGALDEQDAAQVQEHLETCSDCRGQLAELERVAAVLPQTLAALGPQPPAELKRQVMAAVADDATVASRNERRQPVRLSPMTPAPSRMRPDPFGGRARQARFSFNLVALARLAAAAVVILALGWSFRLAAALEQERAIRAEFAALVSQQEVVLEVVDSDKTVRRVLLTTAPERCEPGTCPYGKLFTRTDLRHVVAMAARLPSPPAGMAHRLWLTADGHAAAVGTMTLDDKGFGLLVFDADQVGPNYDRAELVLQSEQSRTPEGDVLLLWTPVPAA